MQTNRNLKIFISTFLVLLLAFSNVTPSNAAELKDSMRYKNNALDYSIVIPKGLKVDTSYQPYFTTFYNDEIYIRVSKEKSPYEYDYYFTKYIYKFLLNKNFTDANHIKVYENTYKKYAGYRTKVLSMNVGGLKYAERQMPYYYQALMITGDNTFYMFNIKTTNIQKYAKTINTMLNSFKKENKTASAKFDLGLKPKLPQNWNEETRKYYDRLAGSKDVTWGIFVPYNNEMWNKVNDMEKKLDYDFGILLKYLWIGEKFPKDVLDNAHADGKVVEFTLQTMWDIRPDKENRNTLNSTLFDILRGEYDDMLKEYAAEFKAFGHPVMLRLDNEMNGTWTVYSGIADMGDPELFISAWRYIYKLFEEEGVDNLIWIFNPNDGSYPPLNWNNQVAYFPGNKYVQLIGITGYNTGTYFQSVTGEHWRSFNEIYGNINAQYYPIYKDFPWIIGEFSSSSVGGDKVKWINSMFDNISKYKNIKAAVWWSYYDPDPKTKNPARRYWLDETPETLKAFKDGVHKNSVK